MYRTEPCSWPSASPTRTSRPSADTTQALSPATARPAFCTPTRRSACQTVPPSARATRESTPRSVVNSAVPSPRTTAGGYMVLPGRVQRGAPVAASSAWVPETVAARTAPALSAITSSQPLYSRHPVQVTRDHPVRPGFPPRAQVVRAGEAVRGRGVDPLAVAPGPPGRETAAGYGPGELPARRVHGEQPLAGGEHDELRRDQGLAEHLGAGGEPPAGQPGARVQGVQVPVGGRDEQRAPVAAHAGPPVHRAEPRPPPPGNAPVSAGGPGPDRRHVPAGRRGHDDVAGHGDPGLNGPGQPQPPLRPRQPGRGGAAGGRGPARPASGPVSGPVQRPGQRHCDHRRAGRVPSAATVTRLTVSAGPSPSSAQ